MSGSSTHNAFSAGERRKEYIYPGLSEMRVGQKELMSSACNNKFMTEDKEALL